MEHRLRLCSMIEEEWEVDLKQAMGENVQIHHLEGSFDEKFKMVLC